jgi:hypothetical protein
MAKMTEPRLVPRLVPQPLWGLSAARLLPQSKWRRIRADAMDESGGACVVCGAAREKGMVGDEVWDYTATLVGVRIICPDCNAVTHFGSTNARGYAERALDHMCTHAETTDDLRKTVSMTEAACLLDISPGREPCD